MFVNYSYTPIISLQHVQAISGAHQALYSIDYKDSSQKVKLPEHETDNLTPSRGLLDGSVYYIKIIIFSGSAAQRGLWPPRTTRFLDHT
jgi:hypothetical protein